MKIIVKLLAIFFLYIALGNFSFAAVTANQDKRILLENFDSGDLSNWTINDSLHARRGPSNWSIVSGVMLQTSKIGSRSNRKKHLDKLGTYALYKPEVAEGNYRASVKLRSNGHGIIGFMFRVKDDDNYYRFSWDMNRGNRYLTKKVNGKFTLIANDRLRVKKGKGYRLEILAMGSQLEIKIDGLVIFNVSDDAIRTGSIALYSWRNNSASFDDVVLNRITRLNKSPIISSLISDPVNIRLTGTSQFNVVANDTDGPQVLTYLWTIISGGGSLDDATIAKPVYSPSTETESHSRVIVNVEVSDGENSVNKKLDLGIIQNEIFSDNFNDRNHTNWVIHDAKNAIKGPSNWSAKSRVMRQSSAIFTRNKNNSDIRKLGTYAYYEPGISLKDYRVQLDIHSTSRDAIGLMFRVKDSNNYYRFSWNKRLKKRQLVKNVDGIFSLLAEDSMPYHRGKKYNLQISVQGEFIKIYIDHELIFSVSDESVSFGTIALYSWRNRRAIFDNVIVSEMRGGNLPPVVSSVVIRDVNGNKAEVGDTFSVAYMYSDEEGDSEGETTVLWQRDGVAIPGATSIRYVSTSEDEGSTLSALVTPAALTGVKQGEPVLSNNVNIINSDVAPVVTAPVDVIAEATGGLTSVTLGLATAVDDRDGVLVPTANISGPFGIGISNVIWSAIDSSGNTGTATQTVTIADTIPPVLSVPANINITASSQPPVPLDIGTATATDLFNVTITNDAPGTFNTGTTTVNWIATDSNGNSSTAIQTVTIAFNGGTGANEIDHLLRRITFGSSPSLLAEVNSIGVDAYLDQQLDPVSMDDSEFDTRISGLPINTREELRAWTLLHMTYSKRQLLEVMTWFWDNHFNTDIRKIRGSQQLLDSAVDFELQENRAFRLNALGNFRQLLDVSSKSPTMLLYLNSVENVKDDANENYARELVELHTMGVDGGYTHAEIEAGAEVFTGWHLLNGAFFFNSAQHNFASQQYLGQTIVSGGVAQGEQLLDILAAHPSTASFICKKLSTVFVSDTPPQSLIDRCATRFQATVNDPDQITQVLRVILSSVEFKDVNYNQTKIKTPVEFAVSIARALEGETTAVWMQNQVRRMGIRLYENPWPTGWSETGDDWISSGLMLERIKTIEYMMRVNRIESLMTDLPALFARNGVSSASEIVRFLLRQTLGESYPDLAYQQAISYLNGSTGFSLTDSDADTRLRRVTEIILSYPQFQFQ